MSNNLGGVVGAIDKIALKLGPLAIHWYAIFIVTGTILAVILTMREAPRKGIDPDQVIDFILIAFPLGLVGVRLYYVIFQWDYYRDHLDQVIALWDGGGAIYGGLLVGGLVLYVFCRRQGIFPLDFLDIVVPGLFIAQSIGRWGNFVNQEAYGAAVNQLKYLPAFIRDQMYIGESYRQPTFLFESLGTLAGFILVMIFRHQIQGLRRGDLFAFYLVWYGLVRFFVEGLREDSLMLGSIRVSQLLSAFLVLIGLGLWLLPRRKKVG